MPNDLYIKNSKIFGWGKLLKPNPEKAFLLDNFASGSCLDVGCGSGIYTNYLQIISHHTIGIDQSNNLIKKCKKRFPSIDFRKQSVFNRVPKSDTIILFDILEHIDDKKALLHLSKHTKRFIISVPMSNQKILSSHSLSHLHYLDSTHLRYYTPKSLKKLLCSCHLKIKYLKPALPISLYSLFVDHVSEGNLLKKTILKIILRPFLPEKPIYSTIFAVADVI